VRVLFLVLIGHRPAHFLLSPQLPSSLPSSVFPFVLHEVSPQLLYSLPSSIFPFVLRKVSSRVVMPLCCNLNVYDDRPSEPESGESTDHRSFKNHKQNGILILSSIALSSALMKGTFFYFGNAKYIVPIIYFNLYKF
jgi:hypothetical protein